MCNFFGGASQAEQSDAASQGELAKSLQQDFGQRFGQQSTTLDSLNSVINRIQSGDTGPGFGADENAARTSNIINNSEAGARNAMQATAERAAGVGGGGDASGLARSSAIRQALNAAISAQGANQKSDLLAKNTAANYEQGRLNAAQTAGGLERLAGLQNPEGFASAASGANQAAFGMDNKINTEDTSGGLFGSLLTAGVGLAGKAITGGIAGGGGFADTLKGALGGITGQDYLNNPS
jgi:hypothetical protein